MNESKIELTERLRREGRWAESSLFKDQELKKLRSSGMTKAEAGDEAWSRMAEKFPPLVNTGGEAPAAATAKPSPLQQPTAPEHGIDVDALLNRIGDDRQPADLVKDTLWVYGALENRRAKPDDAPSLGAWSLLLWARQYRNRFFEQVLPKAMLNKPPEDEENQRQERRKIEEIRGILGKFQNAEEAELQRDLRADTPAAIQAGVRSRLEDWAGHFGLTLADNARTGLEARICGFIQDCSKAFGRTPGGVRQGREGGE